MSTIKETTKKAVDAGSSIIAKAKKAVKDLGTERYDRKTYTSEATKNQSLVKQADAILSNRPNILNESDQSDPEFRTVVTANSLRAKAN